MERIEIPGHATYTPVALSDVFVGAPLASRLLLGAVLPGNLVSGLALGLYVGSAARDWIARYNVRPVDFLREYDADIKKLDAMPKEARREEVRLLGSMLNRGFVIETRTRAEVARAVNRHLTDYIAAITDQEIVTSSEVRDFTLARVVFPFALGACDMISGDVAIFKDTGPFEPHVIAHEFCHRKGYFKELHAQALAYMALRVSGDPALVQSARIERLHRQLRVLSGDDPKKFAEHLAEAALRPELERSLRHLRPDPGALGSVVGKGMRTLYDQRMRLTGQNGISDYDEGFTNFLWTFAWSRAARQPREHAAI